MGTRTPYLVTTTSRKWLLFLLHSRMLTKPMIGCQRWFQAWAVASMCRTACISLIPMTRRLWGGELVVCFWCFWWSGMEPSEFLQHFMISSEISWHGWPQKYRGVFREVFDSTSAAGCLSALRRGRQLGDADEWKTTMAFSYQIFWV